VEMVACRFGRNNDDQLAGSISSAGISPLGTRSIRMGHGSGGSRHIIPSRVQPVVADRNHRSRRYLSIPILLVIGEDG
jgi:hypothetical protein